MILVVVRKFGSVLEDEAALERASWVSHGVMCFGEWYSEVQVFMSYVIVHLWRAHVLLTPLCVAHHGCDGTIRLWRAHATYYSFMERDPSRDTRVCLSAWTTTRHVLMIEVCGLGDL
jgi:hypothetical protein